MISSVFSKAEYKAQSEAEQRMQKRDKPACSVLPKVQPSKPFVGVVELSRAYFSSMEL